MMCLACVSSMWPTIAASVVDFPDPVPPVTRIRPRSSSASRPITSGSPSDSSDECALGTIRITIDTEPRCTYPLTRNLPSPGAE
jgi:hypothetical protein